MFLGFKGITRVHSFLWKRQPARVLSYSERSQSRVAQVALSYGFAVDSQQEIGALLDLRYLGETISLRTLGQAVGLKEEEDGIFRLPSSMEFEDLQRAFRALQQHALRDHYVPYVERHILRTHQSNRERAALIFSTLKDESKYYEKPLEVRHPWCFYKGHLPAFLWIQMRAAFSENNILDLPPINAHYENLFERGIDPSLRDAKEVLHDNSVERVQKDKGEEFTWPTWQELEAYEEEVNEKFTAVVREVLTIADTSSVDETDRERQKEETLHALKLVLDHDCMHHETLCYMLRNLRPIHKHWNRWIHNDFRRAVPVVKVVEPSALGEDLRWVSVPESTVTRGIGRDKPRTNVSNRLHFTWDCEVVYGVEDETIDVPAFLASESPTTIAQFRVFVREGGYHQERYWQPDHWKYIREHDITHPEGWNEDETVQYLIRTVPLSSVPDHPVSCTLAEAMAFARWREEKETGQIQGKFNVPSEEQWLSAADVTPAHALSTPPAFRDVFAKRAAQLHERGILEPSRMTTNKNDGCPSSHGVRYLVGDGWEWTRSPLRPLPGFERERTYPAYSADFFDDRHFVLKGCSVVTPAVNVRPSARNFFQDLYPYAFCKFRVVRRVE